MIEDVKRLSRRGPVVDALDLCCGEGATAIYLGATEGWGVTGIDIVPVAIQVRNAVRNAPQSLDCMPGLRRLGKCLDNDLNPRPCQMKPRPELRHVLQQRRTRTLSPPPPPPPHAAAESMHAAAPMYR